MDPVFYDIFHPLPRQGPGSTGATLRALSCLGLRDRSIDMLDIGCGTGAQTLDLARHLQGTITAVDNYQPFLDTLGEKAIKEVLKARIACKCQDMNELKFSAQSFDLIWAEGSIYIIGFRRGLEIALRLLRPGGAAVFSDMNWRKDDPPEEVRELFRAECPEMMTVQENIDLIGRSGFLLSDYFLLDDDGHLATYYLPLEERIGVFRKEYARDQKVTGLVQSIQHEIDIYKRFSAYFGYTFYIMSKT
jgi:SAM-dependent methyltransferase